jgi:hypothetical protein
MINIGDEKSVTELMSKSLDELMEIATSGLDAVRERQVIVVLDLFHAMFHEKWSGDCNRFNRMLLVIFILGLRGVEEGGSKSPAVSLFSSDSLNYVLSDQAKTPEMIYDSLRGEVRSGYEQICRHAIEERIRSTLLDREMVTPDTFFSAAMDSLMFLHHLQEHSANASALKNIVVFENDSPDNT